MRLREPMICPKVSSKGCQVEIRSRDRRLRTPHVRFRTTPEFQELCRALLVEAMVARRHFGFLYLEPISINWRTVVTGSVSFVHLAIQLGNRLPCCPGEKFSLADLLKLFGDLLDFLRPRFSGRFSALSSVNVPKQANHNLLRGLRIRLAHAGNVVVTSSSVQAFPQNL